MTQHTLEQEVADLAAELRQALKGSSKAKPGDRGPNGGIYAYVAGHGLKLLEPRLAALHLAQTPTGEWDEGRE